MEMEFIRSSYSLPLKLCVEVARTDGDIYVRDSKNPGGSVLAIGRGEWASFITRIKAG